MSANNGYRPTIKGPLSDNAQAFGSGSFVGEGNPEGVVLAATGSTYCDDVTGNSYTKVRGSGKWGWVRNGAQCSGSTGGGSGGSGSVYFGTGDPNGVVTAVRPAVYYTAAGGLWFKTNATNDNTGWTEILAE